MERGRPQAPRPHRFIGICRCSRQLLARILGLSRRVTKSTLRKVEWPRFTRPEPFEGPETRCPHQRVTSDNTLRIQSNIVKHVCSAGHAVSDEGEKDKDQIVDPPKPRLSLVGANGLPIVPISTIRAKSNRQNPLVRVDTDLDLTVKDAISKLITHPNVYQRHKKLVDVLDGEVKEIRDIPLPILRTYMTSVSTFMGHQKSGQGEKAKMVAKLPSDQIVHAVYTTGEWRARPLVGLTSVPLIRPNGTILQDPGYDDETRFVYAPTVSFPRIEDKPSLDRCMTELQTVLEPLHMFPWKRTEDNRAPSLSAYLSMILTMMMVTSIRTNIPGFIVSANLKGTGKSKLANIASIIVTGRMEQTLAFVADDEENRKRITGALKRDRRIIMFDNVTRKISGDTVDMLLTTRKYSDRELGSSVNFDCDVNSITCWTGNNLEAEGDTTRRVIPIEIESKDLHPEDRHFDFDPELLTMENRVEIVTALLTIVRGWYAAGCPRTRTSVMGSYEEWSSIIPEILVWLGASNPIEARKTSSVVTDKMLRRLIALAALWETTEQCLERPRGLTVQDVMRFLYPGRTEATHLRSNELRAAFEDLTGEFGREALSRSLSYTLRIGNKRALNAEGRSFRIIGQRDHVSRWTVVSRSGAFDDDA